MMIFEESLVTFLDNTASFYTNRTTNGNNRMKIQMNRTSNRDYLSSFDDSRTIFMHILLKNNDLKVNLTFFYLNLSKIRIAAIIFDVLDASRLALC